jgi:hypothetical protein
VPSGSTSREALAKSFARQDRHPDKSRNEPPRLLPFPQKLAVPRGRGRHSDASTSLIGRRQTLRNIGNVDLRHILSDEVPSTVKFPAIVSSTRRIVSDPTPQLARSLSSKLAAPSSAFTSSKDHHTSEQEPHRKNLPFPLINHPLLSVPDINLGSLATAKQTPQPHPHLRNPYPGHAAIDVSPSIDLCNVIQFVCVSSSPTRSN